jgi:putative endonuclease
MKQPSVYIIASGKNGTIYTGVTANLVKRIYEHKEGLSIGFAFKYNCKILVFYELCYTMENAILRGASK